MVEQLVLEPAARIDRLLREESIVWLSSVRADGSPHLVPIWFSWDGEQLFIASKPEAVKVRNLRANPKLMVALGSPDDDFDVGLIEAEATLPAASTAELLPRGHLAKYARQMALIGLDEATYVATYSQPILVRPTRYLPWHGRSVPASAVASERPRTWREALHDAADRAFGPLRRVPGRVAGAPA
ncbi:MAG TPA: pyridoxamine 5'-phosphate oxidase family protein [Candidatus Limnocylindrales bacterium]